MAEIHLDVLTEVDRRKIRAAAKTIERHFDRAGADAGKAFSRRFDMSVTRSTDRIAAQTRKVADSQRRIAAEQAKVADVHRRSLRQYDHEVKQVERINDLHADRVDLLVDIDRQAERNHRRELDRIRTEARERQRALDVSVRQRGRAASPTLGGSGGRGGTRGALGSVALVGGAARGAGPAALVAAAPLVIKAADDMIGIAVTASQSIALIPAAATAAAAGIGTLNLAMSGFSDVMDDIRDPEKFAAGLATISPNAQQAALSIRNLLPAFDALKASTQDALFAGVGPELHRLTNTLLPSVQGLTTSIAGSFNEMFMGFSQTLQDPAVQQDISRTFGSIGTAFQNLTPLIPALTQAFADLAAEGSQFLPGLATGLSDAARDFAATIRNMSENGDLRTFIQDGISAVGALADSIFEIGKTVYKVFGQDGKQNIEDFKTTAIGLNESLKHISETIRGISDAVKAVIDPMRQLLNMASFLPNLGKSGLNAVFGTEFDTRGTGDRLFGPVIDQPAPPVAAPPTTGDLRSLFPTGGGTGQPRGLDDMLGSLAGQPGTPVTPGPMPNAGLGAPQQNIAVPPPPPAGGGSGGRSLPAYADPAQFTVGGTSQQAAVLRAEHALEEARLRLINLKAEGNASQLELLRAENDVVEREAALREAQARSTEKMAGSLDKSTKQLDRIGVALDNDLGISDGLAGMADNLVRFLGNVAFADMLGKLEAVKQVNMAHHGLTDPGMGLAGMFLPPASSSVAPMGSTPATSVAGASIPKSRFSDANLTPNAARLNDIIPALFPSISDIGGYRQDPHPDHPSGQALDIMIPGGTTRGGRNPAGKALGDSIWAFLSENAEQLGVDIAGSLWRTDTGGDHFDHIHARVRAGAAGALGNLVGGGGGGSLGVSGGSSGGLSIPVPLPVVIVGGGAAHGGYPLAPPVGPAGPVAGAARVAGMAPAGLPGGAPTPGLGTPGGPATPGLGVPVSSGMGTGPLPGPQGGPPPVSGMAPGQGGFQPAGGGFSGMGGAPMGALKSSASAAANAFAPGSGAAAESAIELINRTIAFGGQAVGIGIQGIGETLLPKGSQLGDPSNNLLMRVAGGFAGARPAQPTTAAKQDIPMKDEKSKGQGGGQDHGRSAPLIGTMQYTGPADDGQKVGRDINRQINAHGAGDSR